MTPSTDSDAVAAITRLKPYDPVRRRQYRPDLGHAEASYLLTESTVGYRRLFARLTPAAQFRVKMHGLRMRAELYRRMNHAETLIDVRDFATFGPLD